MTVDVLILYDLLVSHYMTVEKIRPKTARLVLIIMLSLQFILIAKIGRHSRVGFPPGRVRLTRVRQRIDESANLAFVLIGNLFFGLESLLVAHGEYIWLSRHFLIDSILLLRKMTRNVLVSAEIKNFLRFEVFD